MGITKEMSSPGLIDVKELIREYACHLPNCILDSVILDFEIPININVQHLGRDANKMGERKRWKAVLGSWHREW